MGGNAQDSDRGVGTLSASQADSPESKRALVIGISDYHAASLDLRYADDDARLFFDYLKNVEQIPQGQIDTLMNTDATASNIYGALRSLVETTEAGQVTYIYFAGHGDVVTQFYGDEGYFLAADANDQREYNGTGGNVEFAHLNKAIDAIIGKQGKVILVLDACRAGYVVNEDGANKTLASLNSSFQNTTKFLSSQAAQKSYESEEIGHGYFTYYLTLGMMGAADAMPADNELQYVELAQFLNQNVKNETTGKQTPVVQDRDLFRPYRMVSTEEKEIALNALQQSGGIKGLLAARSVSEVSQEPVAGADPVVKLFNKAMAESNYAGNDSSAYSIYSRVKERENYPASLREQMRRTLVNTLTTFSQLVINSYIGGEEPLPRAAEFDRAADYLALSLGIMDEAAYNYDQLMTSELFLRGYSIIRDMDYSSYGSAKSYLLQALEKEPRAAYIHNALGILYNHEEDYQKAEWHYRKAGELIPTWAFPVNNIGTNYLDLRNYGEAAHYFRESMVMDSAYSVSYNNYGVVQENLGRYSEAETYYRKSLSYDPGDAISLKNMGNLFEKRGNLKAAEEWYKQALAKDTSYVYSYYSLAEFLYENNLDLNYAEELLQRAIALQPYYAEGYTELADFYRRESSNPSHLSVSDSLYARAVALDSTHTWGYAGRGWLHHKLGNRDQALRAFNEGIEKNSDKPDAYYYLGDYYSDGLQQYDLAMKYLNQAIAIDSLYFSAYEELVGLHISRRDYDRASVVAERITTLNPEAPDVWNLLGDVHFQAGRYDKAIDAYRQTIALDSTYAKGYVNLAYSLITAGQYHDAGEYFQRAHEYNPYRNRLELFMDYLIAQAGRSLRLGDRNTAGRLLMTAYGLDGGYKKTLFELAELNYLQGATVQAFQYLEKLSGQELSRTEQIKFLILSIKSGIDGEEAESGDKLDELYSQLQQVNPRQDYLLAMLVHHRTGNSEAMRAAAKKINKAQFSERYLQSNYSDKTVDLIQKIVKEISDEEN